MVTIYQAAIGKHLNNHVLLNLIKTNYIEKT